MFATLAAIGLINTVILIWMGRMLTRPQGIAIHRQEPAERPEPAKPRRAFSRVEKRTPKALDDLAAWKAERDQD